MKVGDKTEKSKHCFDNTKPIFLDNEEYIEKTIEKKEKAGREMMNTKTDEKKEVINTKTDEKNVRRLQESRMEGKEGPEKDMRREPEDGSYHSIAVFDKKSRMSASASMISTPAQT